MLPIKQMLLTNHNRPGIQLRKLKGIVMHWTANESKGADALANRNYFNSTDRGASAHYIVDDHQIIQCIPDNEVAWHVGANSYRTAGDRIMEKPYGPNYFLLGIEMCVNSDGNWNKTYRNAVELAAFLLKKYNLTQNDLYRHYDITGKDCPKMMIDESSWRKFKNDVENYINGKNPDSNPAPKPPVLNRLLKLTNPLMSGEDIKILQDKLNKLGFNSGKADGFFGSITENAVKQFQKSKWLSVDGIVGPATWGALFK